MKPRREITTTTITANKLIIIITRLGRITTMPTRTRTMVTVTIRETTRTKRTEIIKAIIINITMTRDDSASIILIVTILRVHLTRTS